jgi:hypothetical protein
MVQRILSRPGSVPCPGPCSNTRDRRKYVCGSCWYGLRPITRASLNRKDDKAPARLHELYQQLHTSVPLTEIEVTR